MFANGDKYEGQFEYGMRSGNGVLKWSNGCYINGNWIKDQLNGDGIYFNQEGEKILGYFENNNFIQV